MWPIKVFDMLTLTTTLHLDWFCAYGANSSFRLMLACTSHDVQHLALSAIRKTEIDLSLCDFANQTVCADNVMVIVVHA
jgi:hypothetical protein